VAQRRPAAEAALVPLVDHHRHLQSPLAAQLGAEPPLPTIPLPTGLDQLLQRRAERWNAASALAGLYTEDAALLDPTGPRWIRGRVAVANRVAEFFRAPYRVAPTVWSGQGTTGHLAGYFTREDGASTRYLGHVLLVLEKDAEGIWRISAETPLFDGPVTPQPVTADQLVGVLDDAGIQRAVVLSLAYWFGSPRHAPVEDEYVKVIAENDWTAAQAARFPNRLIAFCSFNPLKEYALRELDRCANDPHFVGVKLHFANSGVDVLNGKHTEKLRQVFRAANEHRLPIVVHLWVPNLNYGREHSAIFLEQILTAAPDVVVQVAHFAGGGSGYVDPAIAPFAEAIAAGDPRTRNVYFDLTSVADGRRSQNELQRLAARMREVGLDRILFGSDMAPPPAWQPWMTFRMSVPLTAAEFQTVAAAVAPYLR
jgi:predicted TIM-barrel fold metal-dependent hydrolase/ketosteroid isomerase-like protein